ncbi:MAG: hypothetical protein WC356_03570 [Candidatus Micrarchaeia archaeon]|jgi:hypothetical protein
MADFSITSPKAGRFEGIPSILLSDVYVATDSANIREQNGEYRKLKGRAYEFYDKNYAPIVTPVLIYAITAISEADHKFTIAGENKTDIEAEIIDSELRVNGSTDQDNDQIYTVVSITENGGNTEIVVTEDIVNESVAAKGNLFVGATPVMKYHYYKKPSTKTESLFVATAYHIWLWNNSAKTLEVKFTCDTPASVKSWQIVTHSDFNVYATNNVDLVQMLVGENLPTAGFDDLGGDEGIPIDGTLDGEGKAVNFIVKAKIIISYQSYLFLGYVTYNSNDVFNNRIHWSSRASAFWDDSGDGDWNINGSGDAGLKDFTNDSDVLTGFGKWNDYMVVFKQNTHHTGWLVTDETVFNWREEDLKVGAIGADSIVNDKQGRLYWFASDFSIREIRTQSEISIPIKDTLVNIATGSDANAENYAEYIQAAYIPEYRSVYFAIPYGVTTTNNKVVEFNTDTGNFFVYDMAVSAFGHYTRQVQYTYDTLPYSTYDEWGLAWLMYDINRNSVGYAYILASDYSGNTFALHQSTKDVGEAFNGTLVFNTTLSQPKNLPYRKRVNNGATFIFNRKITGTVTIYIQPDTKKDWTTLGTVSLVDATEPDMVSVHLPFDTAFKTAKFKLESPDDMEFVGALFTDFQVEDER